MKIRRITGYLILSLLTAFFLYACGGGGSDSSPAPPAPDVTTGEASDITITSALLSGVVNPNGVTTDAWFEWGTDNTLGTMTPSKPVGSGTTDNTVTQSITGLDGGTTYYYRAAASSSGGTVLGEIRSFITAPPVAPPSAQTLPATNITTTSALLNGTVIPNRLATDAWFQWGTDNTLSATPTPIQAVGSGTSSVSVNAAISGLSDNTTYYFRIVAQNTEGETLGDPVRIFTTPQNPPPTADAGPDQEIYRYGPFGFNTVTLDGSGSFDDYGTIESYEWTQLSGTSVALDNNTAEKPTFTVPAVSSPGENLPFQLTVTDDRAISDTDIVDVNVLWGFLDDFSSDSTSTYTLFRPGSETFTYMPGAQNVRVITGNSYLEFQHRFGDVTDPVRFTATSGVFSFDFYPRDKQAGGGIEFTISEDATTQYKFSTLTGEALKMRAGTVVDNVAFPTSYATYTSWPIKVTFTRFVATVEAFGSVVTLSANENPIPAWYFSVILDKQDGDFDNFKLEAIP